MRFLDHARRVQQRLRRNAADVQADAAERRPALDERDLQPKVRRPERRRVAAGPGADHHEPRTKARLRSGACVAAPGALARGGAEAAAAAPQRAAAIRCGRFRGSARLAVPTVALAPLPRPRLARGAGACAARGASAETPASLGASVRIKSPALTFAPALHRDGHDLAGARRRHVHRRLVRLERDQRIFGRERVAGLHVHVDHVDVVEVADVGNANFDVAHSRDLTVSPRRAGPRRRGSRRAAS